MLSELIKLSLHHFSTHNDNIFFSDGEWIIKRKCCIIEPKLALELQYLTVNEWLLNYMVSNLLTTNVYDGGY